MKELEKSVLSPSFYSDEQIVAKSAELYTSFFEHDYSQYKSM